MKSDADKTPHDNLRLPDGRKVRDVGSEIATLFVTLGIPGASHEKGRASNIEAYAAYLQRIYDDAGKLAVAAWLAEREGASRI